jgi:sugar lactone lactonase YvrE
MGTQVGAPYPHRDELGEGPHWDSATQTLLWVDIFLGKVHRLDPQSGDQHAITVGPPVTFAIPTSGGGIIVGRNHTVELIRPEEQLIGPEERGRVLTAVEADLDDTRLNDGKCDAAGRLVFGTMSLTRQPGAGALYRLDGSGAAECLVTGVTLSNGLGWDQTGHRFYHVDSVTQQIDLFDYEPATGALTDRRPFVRIEPEIGLPDGLAVDAEGGVWIVLFGGGAVRRYSPDGQLSEVVPLPVSCPTSLTFGGAELRTAYVTSSRHRLSEAQKLDEPLAGAVFTFDSGVAGCPIARFDIAD